MKLLFHSYCYPPLRYPRSIQVARLAAHLPGGNVTVVCAEEETEGDLSLLEAYPDTGREVVRVPWGRLRSRLASASERLAEKVLIPDRYRLWQSGAANAVERRGLLENADALVTFGQPMSDHLFGLRLARASRRIPWIAHFSDPWADNPFRVRGRLGRSLNLRLEARVAEQADALVFTAEEQRDLVLAKYPAPLGAKAHVVPHAHDPALYPEPTEQGDSLVARYIGTFYGNRSPEPLLRALQALTERQPVALRGVRVEFVGAGRLPEESSLEFVGVRGPVDYLESLELMRASDLLLVVDAPGETSPFLPSKLIDYAGARRPIVAIAPEGPSASLIRRLGGWQANPSDPVAGAAALAEGLSAARDRPRRWGRDEVVRSYTAGVIARRFLDVIEAIAPR